MKDAFVIFRTQMGFGKLYWCDRGKSLWATEQAMRDGCEIKLLDTHDDVIFEMSKIKEKYPEVACDDFTVTTLERVNEEFGRGI